MHRTHRAAVVTLATAATVTAALVTPVATASADPAGSPARSGGSSARTASNPVAAPGSDVREVGPDLNGGKPSNLKPALKRKLTQGARAAQAPGAATDSVVGDTKDWLATDDTKGDYLKSYTLRAIGDHIQVWVAESTAFPEGDCRTDLGLTDITDAQVDNFVTEFDTNIYPKESASFSVPPSRDGANALLTGPDDETDYYQVSDDQADDIVVLVDNVRDANYYDPGTPDGQTYIAGFFSSLYNEYTDRNVMTIDAFDWLHRTGANPPDDTDDPAYLTCAQSTGSNRAYGGANARLYEGTFAHEYQHLLEYYVDSDEDTWVNEGLSDYAQTLVGYVDTNLLPTVKEADSHIACFQGYLGESFGGAENSLTRWEDQGGPEVLCDYGAAYSIMMYLQSHYGEKFMSALHTQPGNGLVGLKRTLKQFKSSKTAQETVHDWLATMALDAAIDGGKKNAVQGGEKKWLTSSQLKSEINWASPQSYNSLGAPSNGADYVRFGRPGKWVRAKQLNRIRFNGAKTLAPDDVEWTVDQTPPDGFTADNACGALPDAGTGAPALYSGCGENLDRSIVRPVTVPASGGDLTFESLYDIEEGWDFGFVQVSTDGGASWTSLPTADTTTEHDPGAVSNVVEQLPGFTGESDGWTTQTADLSAYKGKKVLVGFRYITDPAANESGFYVRNIDAAGTKLPSGSLAGWKTITQVSPQEVPGWTVQLVGIAKNGKTWIHRMKLDGNFRGTLQSKPLRKALGRSATTVAALVTMDDPSESATKYGRYRLSVSAPQLQGNRMTNVGR